MTELRSVVNPRGNDVTVTAAGGGTGELFEVSGVEVAPVGDTDVVFVGRALGGGVSAGVPPLDVADVAADPLHPASVRLSETSARAATPLPARTATGPFWPTAGGRALT
jgi:hypothetical protein